ncbi:MAG: DUF3795 domain-containing protein [Acidobacteria bacterium]|nr:MAG: DUF3795 domain-containing protein [Acidobacteriota bacterium]
MVGYCGIDCLECRAYKATLEGDEKGLQEMAETFGKGVLRAHDWVCLGCGPQNQHLLATYCDSCRIRLCAATKGVFNCAECETFERCATLQEFLGTESETLARTMGWLRASYRARRGRPASRSTAGAVRQRRQTCAKS